MDMKTPGNKLKSRKCTFKNSRVKQFRFFNTILSPRLAAIGLQSTRKGDFNKTVSPQNKCALSKYKMTSKNWFLLSKCLWSLFYFVNDLHIYHKDVKEDALGSAQRGQKLELVISAQQGKSLWTAFRGFSDFPLSFSSVCEILFCHNSIGSSRHLHQIIFAIILLEWLISVHGVYERGCKIAYVNIC